MKTTINLIFFLFIANQMLSQEATWTSNRYLGERGIFFSDVTGDGKADAIVVNNSGITVRRSDGCKFTANENWTERDYFGERGTFFADVTGDGRADAIVVNNWGVTVRRSDGTKFTGNETWTSNPYFGERGIFFADVTGDGKADAVVVNTSGVTVRRSDGTKFTGNETWTSNPYLGDRGIFFADVTGDGKADAIVVNNSGVTVRRSDGTKFTGNETWTSNPYFGDRGIFFADVTGYGKADAIVVNNLGVTVRPSDGTKFTANENWTERDYFGERGTFFADVTGDGKADAIVVNNWGVSVRESSYSISRFGCSKFKLKNKRSGLYATASLIGQQLRQSSTGTVWDATIFLIEGYGFGQIGIGVSEQVESNQSVTVEYDDGGVFGGKQPEWELSNTGSCLKLKNKATGRFLGIEGTAVGSGLVWSATSNTDDTCWEMECVCSGEYYTFKPEPIQNLCPTRKTKGDAEFGAGPLVNWSVELLPSSDQRQVIAKVTFKAAETANDYSTVEQEFRMPIWTAPSGRLIESIVNRYSQNNGRRGPNAGSEIFGCNDGEVVLDFPSYPVYANDGCVKNFQFIGDTGGNDISPDNDCGCDTKITRIEFMPIIVKLR